MALLLNTFAGYPLWHLSVMPLAFIGSSAGIPQSDLPHSQEKPLLAFLVDIGLLSGIIGTTRFSFAAFGRFGHMTISAK